MPLSVLRVELPTDARHTAAPGLTRWIAAAAGAAIAAFAITIALFPSSPTSALVVGVMFGPMLGGPLGYWIGPRFYPQALWFVRLDKAGEWQALGVDPEWPVRWTRYFGNLRTEVAKAAQAQQATDTKGVSDVVDKFLHQGPEKPTARFDASSMYELENMDDERADYRSPDLGVSKFVAGSIIGLVAVVILSTMLFAILTSE